MSPGRVGSTGGAYTVGTHPPHVVLVAAAVVAAVVGRKWVGGRERGLVGGWEKERGGVSGWKRERGS